MPPLPSYGYGREHPRPRYGSLIHGQNLKDVVITEIVDQDGKSSLLSLVKAFDSVFDVYEGFCNLKQVDLKLKICRGTSIKKILVREAQSYSAATVIVGTAHNHIKLRPSTSLAKYCAKKLSKDCWVLAVNNGKVEFKREGSPTSASYSKGTEDHHRNYGLLRMIQETLKKNTKVPNEGNASVSLKERFENGTYQEFEVNMHLVYNLWVMSFMQTGTIDVLSRE